MIEFVPLQLVDDFLLNYNAGQAVLLLFALSVLATIPLASRKVVSLNAIVFGLVFALMPVSLGSVSYRFFGLALLIVAPLLYATANR